jgi:hypothetical protein
LIRSGLPQCPTPQSIWSEQAVPTTTLPASYRFLARKTNVEQSNKNIITSRENDAVAFKRDGMMSGINELEHRGCKGESRPLLWTCTKRTGTLEAIKKEYPLNDRDCQEKLK